MKPFYTFSLSTSSSFVEASTREYVLPTHSQRKAKFEVGKTYRIKYKTHTRNLREYEILVTSVNGNDLGAKYFLVGGVIQNPLDGLFYIDRSIEVVEIEPWKKYYTYSGSDCFNNGVSCGEYLMKKSNGIWTTYDKLGTGRTHNKEDSETYDGFVKNGIWVETTPEKAFSRDKD